MLEGCQHCGAQLAVGAVACFRCGRMVARAEEGGTGASVVLVPTQIGTVARAELLEGQWRLVKLLGQGAAGQVWQAHDVTLDRAVAVKLMHEAVAADPAQVARFEREARVLAALEHPNLLPVLGIGRSGTRPFLVTRLLEGLTLAELMHQRGGKLPPAEAARVLVPICEALACLDEAKVVHRDLKPSNIFVGSDQRVTLMDLGSAHELGSELTHFGEVLGTLGYLSPEQKLGKRDLDGKSDVYALGCLLLEVLSGQVTTENSAAPGVPLPLAQLARAAMSLTPADRPTALELRSKLVPYLIAEEPTTPMGQPLKSEASTQHVVFTPTTGSPAYPHLRAVPSPEPETKEAPKTNYGERPAPIGVVPLTTVARASGPREGAARPSGSRGNPARPSAPPAAVLSAFEPSVIAGDLDAGPTQTIARPSPLGEELRAAGARATPTVRRSRPLSRGAVAVMTLAGLIILGAFGLGLAEPGVQVPAPVRVDQPTVAAPIQKDELQLHQIVEAPRVATVLVPNLHERKSELNSTYGYEKRVVRKPNRGPVKLGALRVTTTISGFVVPTVMWIKRSPAQKLWELAGQTPLELQVAPGPLSIRLQYEADPYILIPYRVLPRKDWPKEVGGMRLEIPVRSDATYDESEGVGEGDPAAQLSRRSKATQPMTQPRPGVGR